MRSENKEILLKGAQNFSIMLSKQELELFDQYLKLIQEYNQKLNLTGIDDETEIIVKHFLDSLSANQFLEDNWSIADFGSGMGCPGIPLKIVRPSLNLILLESNQKKSAFINLALRNLGLTNARSFARRAEDKNFQEKFANTLEAVLARALGKLDLILKLAEPYLKKGGRVIAYKGAEIEPELKSAQKFLKNAKFQLEQIFEYKIPKNRIRKLLILKKGI